MCVNPMSTGGGPHAMPSACAAVERPGVASARRPPARGTAARLLPALLLAHGTLTRPLHLGTVEDLLPALTCALATCGRSGQDLATAEREARRIVELVLEDGPRVRDRARGLLTGAGPAARLVGATVLGNVEWASGNADEGLRLARYAVTCAGPDTPYAWRPYPGLALAAKLIAAGAFPEAAAVIEAAGREAERLGEHAAVVDAAVADGHLLLARGELARARETLGAAVTQAVRSGASWTVLRALSLLAVVVLRTGDVPAAAELLLQCRTETAREDWAFAAVDRSWTEFLVAASELDPAGACELLRTAYADLPASPALYLEQPAAAGLIVRLASSAGDLPLAAGAVATVARLAAASPECPATEVAALHARGLLRRDPEAVRRAAREHRDAWAAAVAREDLAALLREPAGAEDAGEPESRVIKLFDDRGRPGDLRMLAGGRPPTPVAPAPPEPAGAPSGFDELTEAEAQIVRLVAEGLTNRQVARRLARSPHTVNYHLRQIFRKLGIGSRVELTKYYYENGGPAPVADPYPAEPSAVRALRGAG